MKITDRIVSADDIIDAGVCYDGDKVRRLVPSPVPLSALLELDIPYTDKLWASCLVLYPRERTWLAAQYARTALPYTDDVRVLQCIGTCERYAAGKSTYEGLRKAAGAAADAAYAAVNAAYAAYAAAYAAYAAAYAVNAVGAAAHAAHAARAARAEYAADAADAEYAALAADARMLRIFKEALA